jgi:ubiquinone/menaquinone biosynthesis C-methylase UbiE
VVTGLDFVGRALERARSRASAAGVKIHLVHGDVTALRAAGIGNGFRLVLDTGPFTISTANIVKPWVER